MNGIVIWMKLFWTFFKIGLFGFGGGYGMLSLIHNEVVEKQKWISNSEFTDIVAVSQIATVIYPDAPDKRLLYALQGPQVSSDSTKVAPPGSGGNACRCRVTSAQ